MSLPAKIIGILQGVFGISRSSASTVLQPGSGGAVIVRQPGGVAGTDEVRISHDGTSTTIDSRDGHVGLAVAGSVKWGANAVGTWSNGSGNANEGGLRIVGAVVEAVTAGVTAYTPFGASALRCGSGGLINSGAALDAVAAGSATTCHRTVFKKTAIADNTATDIITVTVPNANHAAAIKLTFLSSNGSTDAFESSRAAVGLVVLARTAGANVVATAIALTNAGIATVAAGATHTLAYDLSAIVGAVGASNTFTIRVTIDDSGNTGANQVVVLAELINSEATGVTMAAA